ncbi:hypothetical protein VTG60DRAFT_3018 [Thermothelomyces hinnuleus]
MPSATKRTTTQQPAASAASKTTTLARPPAGIQTWQDLQKANPTLYARIVNASKKLESLKKAGMIKPFKPDFARINVGSRR